MRQNNPNDMVKANLIRILLPLVIFIGVIFCLHHGVVVRKMPDLNSEPMAILVFHVISLFTFGAREFGAPVAGPVMLQKLMYFFYFFAPVVTIVAAADVLSLIRPPFIKWVLYREPYYLVLGYGRVGKSALESINNVIGAKSYVFIVDRNVDESENGFSILFKHRIFFNRDLSGTNDLKPFVSKKCRGVFILTDDEFLNLKIYNELKDQGAAQTFFNVRIRSLELSAMLEDQEKENHKFINIHAVTSDMLFDEEREKNSDSMIGHNRRQKAIFDNLLETSYETVCFLGFGTFGQNMMTHLVHKELIDQGTRVLIFDLAAKKNWSLYEDRHETNVARPELFEGDLTHEMYGLERMKATSHHHHMLLICATNNEQTNIQAASFITGKIKDPYNVSCLIRTKTEIYQGANIISRLFNQKQPVIVPTYSWISMYFEKLLRNQGAGRKKTEAAKAA